APAGGRAPLIGSGSAYIILPFSIQRDGIMSFLASLSQSLCSKAKGKRQKAKKGRGRSSFSLFPFSFCLPPQLEILEERTLLATLPVPQVRGQQVLLDPRLVATTASVLSPAVAIDPINP